MKKILNPDENYKHEEISQPEEISKLEEISQLEEKLDSKIKQHRQNYQKLKKLQETEGIKGK